MKETIHRNTREIEELKHQLKKHERHFVIFQSEHLTADLVQNSFESRVGQLVDQVNSLQTRLSILENADNGSIRASEWERKTSQRSNRTKIVNTRQSSPLGKGSTEAHKSQKKGRRVIENTSPCVQKKAKQTAFYAKLHQKAKVKRNSPKLGKLYKSEDPLNEGKAEMTNRHANPEIRRQQKMSQELKLNQKKLAQVKNTFLKKKSNLEKSLHKLKNEELGEKQRKFVLSQRKMDCVNRTRKINSKAKQSNFIFAPKKHLKRKSFPVNFEGPSPKNFQQKITQKHVSGRRVKNIFPRKKLAIQKLQPKQRKKSDNLARKRSPKTKTKVKLTPETFETEQNGTDPGDQIERIKRAFLWKCG